MTPMTTESMWLNVAMCFLDAVASFTIICLTLETTQAASIRGFLRGDPQSRWAMVRRIVYCVVAFALFAKSIYILDGRIVMRPLDAAVWITIVSAMIFFPALRALGVVDQDRWTKRRG